MNETHANHETTNARLAASLLPRIPAFGSCCKAYSLGLILTSATGLLAPVLMGAGALNALTATVLLVASWVGAFLYEVGTVRELGDRTRFG